MAESTDNAVNSADGAPAAEAAAVQPEPAAAKAASVSESPRPVTEKPAMKTSSTKSKPRRVLARKPKPVAANVPVPTLSELKEKIMANAKSTDFTNPFTDAVSEMQSKAKAAYDKGSELAAEMTDFAKGNVEALVESGKVYAAGVQELGKSYAEEAKSAYEILTADLKELAAVKSPAELFQLQGKLARRNFDAMVAYGSRNTDALSKLASETFAPLSGRLSLAAEKVSKAA